MCHTVYVCWLCLQVLGGWSVLAILCASMSTATGAILATSTVMAHNLFRKVRGAQQHSYVLVEQTSIPAHCLHSTARCSSTQPAMIMHA